MTAGLPLPMPILEFARAGGQALLAAGTPG
jgi:hypothetical protein